MATYEQPLQTAAVSSIAANKLIRNTYTLLAITLVFSAAMAGLAMVMQVSPGISIFCSLGALGLLWFVLPRTANSATGLGVVFAFTGLLGFGLGPILTMYLSLPKGPEIVMTALGGTGVIFLALSGYALTTKKDFSFMGGFLFAGILVAFVAGIAAMLFSMPGLSLAVSAMFVLLMCGLILYQTSQIVNGGETNYILATTTLYVSLYNLFTSLLHLLTAFSGDD
ncbi:MAG: BAX inhibitor (BI)-1/YccA family protein [Gammaproteobacteria bacterium]|nr:MAG: BAX inhibitor (BI)-1/YccA family protein [Gammaproteobacteria bacterium]